MPRPASEAVGIAPPSIQQEPSAQKSRFAGTFTDATHFVMARAAGVNLRVAATAAHVARAVPARARGACTSG